MLEFILKPEVLTILIALVVIIIGLIGRKYLNLFRVVFKLWHWVEKAAIVNDWSGYEKLAWAMDEFQERFYKQYGKEPDPKDEGWAVKVLTWLCKIEDKEDVECFLEPLPEEAEA